MQCSKGKAGCQSPGNRSTARQLGDEERKHKEEKSKAAKGKKGRDAEIWKKCAMKKRKRLAASTGKEQNQVMKKAIHMQDSDYSRRSSCKWFLTEPMNHGIIQHISTLSW